MNRKVKQVLYFLLICRLFLITAWARPEWPSDTGIQAEAGVVMDIDSGAVLFGQNIHTSYPPASITKILTALIVLEHANLQDTVLFSDSAVYNVEADSGNKISVVSGDRLTVEDCLYAMLLVSSNQSANALAEHVAGSISGFVDMMNEKLTELGCRESHFENPSGLNGEHQYVSAYDMALIAQAAYNNEYLVKINSAASYRLAPTANNPDGLTIRNEHRLVITEDSSNDYYFPPAVAGKTGYLIKAGNTLVTYAESDGRRLVSVILKGQPRQYFIDGKELLSFGFRSFKNIEIPTSDSRYMDGSGTINLGGHSYQESDLTIEPQRVITLPLNAALEDAEVTLSSLPPEHPSDSVALLSYSYNDRVIGTAYLLAKNSAEIEPSDSRSADTSSSPADIAPTVNGNTPTKSTVSLSAVIIALLILVVIGLLAGAITWLAYHHKKEAEALAYRRERRRQRLKNTGDEEEFERLMAEWQKKRQK